MNKIIAYILKLFTKKESVRRAPMNKKSVAVVVKKKLKPKFNTKKYVFGLYYDMIAEAAKDMIPAELILAIGWQESRFKEDRYRYEPNFDALYIRKTNSIDLEKKPYRFYRNKKGSSISMWFKQNYERNKERRKKYEEYYGYPAQTRIAASYGFFQLMYSTAVNLGFRRPGDEPEKLLEPETCFNYAYKLLWRLRKKYPNSWKDVIASYNAGRPTKKEDGTYKNQRYVDQVLGHRDQFKELIRKKT